MATTKKYKVRSLPLHRVVVDGDGNRSTQTYRPGATADLTEEEAKRYQHLVEPATKTTTKKETTN